MATRRAGTPQHSPAMNQGVPTSNLGRLGRRPLGLSALGAFFALGVIPSGGTALALAFPGNWSQAMWRLKPDAPAEFAQLGRWAIPLMIGVALGCACAAIGLWTRKRWGRWLAMGVLSINLLGDVLNAIVRHDWRTFIGVPIGGLLIAYLLGRQVRAWFAEDHP